MKAIFSIIAVLFCLNVFSQTVYTDSITIAEITGTDTTIFINFRTEQGSNITFDFTNFNANTSTLDFGYSNDRVKMTSIDDTRNPFTLNVTTYAKAVNGTTKSCLSFDSDKWSYKYIAFKLTKGTTSAGTLIYSFVR